MDTINENDVSLVDICPEMGFLLLSTSFEHMLVHRSIWRRDDRGEQMSLIDYVAVHGRIKIK